VDVRADQILEPRAVEAAPVTADLHDPRPDSLGARAHRHRTDCTGVRRWDQPVGRPGPRALGVGGSPVQMPRAEGQSVGAADRRRQRDDTKDSRGYRR